MIYVGQHKTDNLDDGYMGSGLRIQRAISKYGIDNFEKTILFECSSEEEMNQKEAEIVNEEFIAREDVYNITLGGIGNGFSYVNNMGLNNKCEQCYIARDKIKADSEYAERFKDAIKKGLAKAKLEHPEKFDIHGEKNPMYGKHHSEETKRKLSESHMGDKNSMKNKMWIKNPVTHENKIISKTDEIPNGWERGRFK